MVQYRSFLTLAIPWKLPDFIVCIPLFHITPFLKCDRHVVYIKYTVTDANILSYNPSQISDGNSVLRT